jgi:hypothetical protein
MTGGAWDGFVAVPDAFAAMPNANLEGIVTGISVLVQFLITGLNVLLWLQVKLLEILIDPAFVLNLQNPEMNAFEEMLRKVWQFCRDIVNVAMAFVLIGGAIMTVVTANYENIKKHAPTFVIALIVVNFTWFIPRVILDVANILTNTVYNIPEALGTGDCVSTGMTAEGNEFFEPCRVLKDVKFFEDAENIADSETWHCIKDLICVELVEYNEATSPSTLVLNGLVVNYSQLKNLTDPSVIQGETTQISQVIAFIVKMVVVLLIHVALFFPLLALLAAFVIRIPILWITIAFMPFVVLGYVLKGKFKQFDPIEKILHTFLASAFLPAITAVPLVIGFIMIKAGSELPIPTEIEALKFPLFAEMSSLWTLIWLCMSLGVMWIGVFTALQSQKVGSGIVKSIQGAGEGLGKFAMKAPLGLPFLPVPSSLGGGTASVMQLGIRAKQAQTTLAATGRTDQALATLTGQTGSMPKEELQRLMESGEGTRVTNQIKVDLRSNEYQTIINKAGAPTVPEREKLEQFVSGALKKVRDLAPHDTRMQAMTDEELQEQMATVMPEMRSALNKIREATAPPPAPAPAPAPVPPPPPPAGTP